MTSPREYPLPWKPAPHAGWLLVDATGKQVATFVAWDDRLGTLAEAEVHCKFVAHAVSMLHQNDPASKAHAVPEVDLNRRSSDAAHAAEYNRNDLRIMQRLVVMWADATFPQRKAADALLKLYEEIGELVRNPHSAHEYADILIMLVDLAHMHGVHDLGKAVDEKMKINGQRTWKQTSTGTMQHE